MTDTRRVIALGFFDGLHIGHQALMKTAVRRAAELRAQPSVISFDTHPDALVFGKAAPLLGSIEDRKDLIRRIGEIDDIIIIHFDREFMHTPWIKFLSELKNELGAVHLVMGDDFRCGWRGEGTAERIAGWCAENGLGCDIVTKVRLDGIEVSSTHIRRLVTQGDMERAALFLGHPHTLTDTIGRGNHIGHGLGAPTINMRIPDGVVEPRHGVYAARVWIGEETRLAVTNVGVRPTFGESGGLTVESNLLDFDGDLYGASVRLEFYSFLRDERRFPTPQALGEQIRRDTAAARAFFMKNV